jgi:hypothetical protein
MAGQFRRFEPGLACRLMALIDVRDAAILCLKLRDERTQRRHRNPAAIGPITDMGLFKPC